MNNLYQVDVDTNLTEDFTNKVVFEGRRHTIKVVTDTLEKALTFGLSKAYSDCYNYCSEYHFPYGQIGAAAVSVVLLSTDVSVDQSIIKSTV